MQGSLILAISATIRARVARGESVCNLTVGDFDPRHFPIPAVLSEAIHESLGGQTNYPPSEGIPELRRSVAGWYARRLGLDFSPDWVIIASGARPVMYATYRMFLEKGDKAVWSVPSWNNSYYAHICEAEPVLISAKAEHNFFPTADSLAPALRGARMLAINSPLNPTGTVIDREQLADIARAVVEENRTRKGEKPLMWMWDQVYWQLCFGGRTHVHPCALVPEVTPYVVTVDAISKTFASTGLRVGWAVLPPALAERMGAFIGHVGAWAPRPFQKATCRLLDDDAATDAFLDDFRSRIHSRLDLLSKGLTRLGVDHMVPQGAMYLSVRFDRFGQPGVDGAPMRTNEDIRRWLLEKAGVAVVPFQAFDMEEDSGWFRMSVGAVSLADLEGALERLGKIL